MLMSSHALRGRVRGRKKKMFCCKHWRLSAAQLLNFSTEKKKFFRKKKKWFHLDPPSFFQYSNFPPHLHNSSWQYFFFFFQFRPAAVKEGNVSFPVDFVWSCSYWLPPNHVTSRCPIREFHFISLQCSLFFHPKKMKKKIQEKFKKKKMFVVRVCVSSLISIFFNYWIFFSNFFFFKKNGRFVTIFVL